MKDTDQIAAEAFRKITEAGASSNPDTFIAIIKSAIEKAEQAGFKRGLTFYERNQKTGEILLNADERLERGGQSFFDKIDFPWADHSAAHQTSAVADASEHEREHVYDGSLCWCGEQDHPASTTESGYRGDKFKPSWRKPDPATASEPARPQPDERVEKALQDYDEGWALDSLGSTVTTNAEAYETGVISKPDSATPSGGGKEWTPVGKFGINVGADTFTPQCYDTGSRDVILNAHNATLSEIHRKET